MGARGAAADVSTYRAALLHRTVLWQHAAISPRGTHQVQPCRLAAGVVAGRALRLRRSETVWALLHDTDAERARRRRPEPRVPRPRDAASDPLRAARAT